ncbi:(Fe-S)-binding protein [Alicyclobacillus ferrooxydans]|uniref:(Fe-S)-binding protein n=1 Tax=Alicyclobacillus ferrooxydans TaxID=471514 RepID=UPI0009FB4829|nr:(Fe-S)-binding protein [Alicyclobacillus ferrooxydans]
MGQVQPVQSVEPSLVRMSRQTAFPFDDAPEEDKYSVCVHCGFCLEVCPTYQELGDENHSPRGRVLLIREAAQGQLPLDASVVDPVFTCLDCRACETVCPSGVQVGSLIETARGQAHIANPPVGRAGRLERLFLRGIFPHPERLRRVARLIRFYQRSGLQGIVRKTGALRLLPEAAREMEAVVPKISEKSALEALPERLPAIGAKKGVGALFTGCVMDVFFSDINQATARVAVRNGLDVVVPKTQVCCGALQIHAGDREQARKMARHNIDVFLQSGADYVIINAAGCGSALKEYPDLFRDDPVYLERATTFSGRVRDISELLVEVGFEAPEGSVERTVTYHDACHLCHAQKVRSQPRQLLRSIPGLKLVDLPDSERCCGSAGIYNLTHPDMAMALLERKMDDIPDNADAVVMGNPGCMMQIRLGVHKRGRQLDVLHTVELLDAAYAGEKTWQGGVGEVGETEQGGQSSGRAPGRTGAGGGGSR